MGEEPQRKAPLPYLNVDDLENLKKSKQQAFSCILQKEHFPAENSILSQ